MNEMYPDSQIAKCTSDTIVMQSTNIFQSLTNQLFVGMLVLRNDFSMLRYNTAALGYIRKILPCPVHHYETLTTDEAEIFSRLILKQFRENGLQFSLRLQNNGNCSVAMAPFVISTENVNPSTYYYVCIADSPKSSAESTFTTAKKYGLSSREAEIADLIVQGHSNREIAEILYISIHTVKTHVENILKKLNVKSRVALISVLQNPSSPKMRCDSSSSRHMA